MNEEVHQTGARIANGEPGFEYEDDADLPDPNLFQNVCLSVNRGGTGLAWEWWYSNGTIWKKVKFV